MRIRDPKDENKTAAEVYLNNSSLSTSGNYEKFFWAEGKLYSHIMDPRTGYPSEGMLSVSVVTPKTIDSEIWAKPYYILGRKWAIAHKPGDFRVLLCEDKPGLDANGCSKQWTVFGCVPEASDRCTACLVYASGRPLSKALPRHSN